MVNTNQKVIKENEIFKAFLQRNNVSENDDGAGSKGRELRKKHRRGRLGKDADDGEDDGLSPTDGSKKKRGAARQRLPTELTIEQKCEIASAEFDAIQREIDQTKGKSEKLIDTLKSVIEETEIRISDLKKDAYEFKRDIVIGAENFRTGKTMAEKVIRYMEEKLRQRDAQVEKLKLKNQTLRSQVQKVDAQLRQKEEMGDVLHYIDFHQLQIENKQYVAKIEERNQDLLKLKMTTGSTVQVLNSLKKQLQDNMSESDWLRKEISARSDMLRKIKRDNISVTDEIRKESRRLRQFKDKKEDVEGMPEVMDYVLQKKRVYELEQEIANWERKIEIAEMEARHSRSLRAISRGK
eukprot:g4941.t1